MAKISIIAAMSQNRAIGNQGSLPWPEPIPADWEHLERVTEGCQMIMGRKSYEDKHRVSSKAGNYVVSSQSNLELDEGFQQVGSLKEALELTRKQKEVFVIGGNSLFEEAILLCDNLYLTEVQENFEGDTFFPEFDSSAFKTQYAINFAVSNESPYPMVIKKMVKV